jgi:hypothetical protein
MQGISSLTEERSPESDGTFNNAIMPIIPYLVIFSEECSCMGILPGFSGCEVLIAVLLKIYFF